LLYAAGMNGYDVILRAMGVLGDAVREPDLVSETAMILMA
jgi:hypothetical protein